MAARRGITDWLRTELDASSVVGHPQAAGLSRGWATARGMLFVFRETLLGGDSVGLSCEERLYLEGVGACVHLPRGAWCRGCVLPRSLRAVQVCVPGRSLETAPSWWCWTG